MTKNEALTKCMKMCSLKEYAPSEVLDKLLVWGMPEEQSLAIVKELKDEKFVDEFRMARFYANDKLRFNKWGKIKIRYMLQQKGLSILSITEALEGICDEEYAKILFEEMQKKQKALRETDNYKANGKLYQFAAGRGFESELIYKTINQLK